MASYNSELLIPVVDLAKKSASKKGSIVYDRGTETLYVANGSQWNEITVSGKSATELVDKGISVETTVNSVRALKLLGIPVVQNISGFSLQSIGSIVYDRNLQQVYVAGSSGWSQVGGNSGVANISAANSTISISGNLQNVQIAGNYVSGGAGLSIVGNTITNTLPAINYSSGTGISIVGSVISNTQTPPIFSTGFYTPNGPYVLIGNAVDTLVCTFYYPGSTAMPMTNFTSIISSDTGLPIGTISIRTANTLVVCATAGFPVPPTFGPYPPQIVTTSSFNSLPATPSIMEVVITQTSLPSVLRLHSISIS